MRKYIPRHNPNLELLRAGDICRPHGVLPLCRSTWYAYVAANKAPQPIRLSPRVVAWKREDVFAFAEGRFVPNAKA